MNTTITTETRDLSYTRSEAIHYAETMVSSEMNLSEELAISIAQHHLSTELGCDLDTILALDTDASNDGKEWFVTFTGEDTGEDQD